MGGNLGSVFGGWGVWVQCLRGGIVLGLIVLSKCIWNGPVVSLVLTAFDGTSSLGSPPHQVVYPPGSIVPTWVTASHFLSGNREAELNSTTFSSLLLFHVFL